MESIRKWRHTRYVVDHGIENNLHTCPMDNNSWTVSEGQLDG